YAFSDLPAGNFQVGISGYDTDDFSFETTSKNVALALGETATVPFEGILLRTSGISGRVSVEGDGLDSVTVTLSGDDLDEDMTSMTDASGQYAIAGLAEGDYTVTISDYDDVAYDFETTSMDVSLGDDDTQIVNFMGTHDRTASLTVMMYVDEAGKNDAYDEGEEAFPSTEMLAEIAKLGIPLDMVGQAVSQVVSLRGPGVLDMQSGTISPTGGIVFSGLKAGQYQLVYTGLPATTPSALLQLLRDYAYGGPATGYPMAITVGQQASRQIPIDITHTTVHFGVTLKAGENRGAPLAGATVTLYSDMAGELKITDAETGETGLTAIRIARAGTDDNTVYAAVEPPEGDFHTSGMMQPVPWNPKYPATMAGNEADIVNLKADFSFSGATITTDMGGGKALGGWAISVSSGDDAVDGAPEALGADGTASFSEVVDAADLPKTYTVAVAGNQANTLDGGESYKGTELEHVHHGLSLPATMDAGTIEVKYTTQTLKVYVHHERDQVLGYTGNVLGGDARASGVVDVDIRHIERSSGRSREFTTAEWNPDPPGSADNMTDAGGVVTFKQVPADAQVIVTADLEASKVRLLKGQGHADELAAYTDQDGNGIMGGAFGDDGGFHHTVELCPLMRTDPTGQRFGECASFAFVSTYRVYGQAWKHIFVPASSGDGWVERDLWHVPGTTVTLAKVEGENLAGTDESFTAASTNSRATRHDDRKQFIWGMEEVDDTLRKAAGVYKVTPPPGWVANVGAPHDAVALGSSLNPLAGDLQLDVTPTTGFVYGRVTGSNGFPVEDVTVHVNGVTATTDEFGRYTAEGFPAQTRRINFVWYRNKIFVETNHPGHSSTNTLGEVDFAANTPMEVNVTIAGSTKTATISGRVIASGTGAPVAGAAIWVDYPGDTLSAVAPLNAARSGVNRGKLVTDADGNYSATVVAQAAGTTVAMSATKDDMSFTPAEIDVSAIEGSSISGISFTGFAKATISGRVSSGGRPMEGATVVAEQVGGTAVDTAVTGVTGIYSLFVPFGNYDVTASKDGYDFSATQRVSVGPGESKSIEDFTATETARTPSSDATLSALSLSDGMLDPEFADSTMAYTAEVGNGTASVTVTATANSDYAAGVVIMPVDADTVEAGHQVDLDVGNTEITAMVTSEDSSATMTYTVTVTRAPAAVTLSASPNPVAEGGEVTVSATVDVAQTDTFTVMVMPGGGVLTFLPGATEGAGEATFMAPTDTVHNETPVTVEVTGTSSDTSMTVDTVEVAVTDDELVASAPRNLEATPGDQSATVTWTAPSSIGSMPITSYEWELTAPATAPVTNTVDTGLDDPANLTASLTNLVNGVTYTFTVHAVSALGDGESASTTVKAQPDLTIAVSPATLVEAGTDTAEVTLTLTQPTREDVTVSVAPDSTHLAGVSNATVIIEAGSTVGTTKVFAIPNLIDADNTFMVVAIADNANDTATSEAITITDDDEAPGAPTSFGLTVGNTQLEVNWNPPTAAGTSDITHYEIRWSTDDLADTDTWTIVSGGASGRTYTITGLTNGTAVNVEVRAVSAAGGGAAASDSATPTDS
ncbi:MAG: fibronectin type III domain-containing protein, partial [Gemmatimonadetes bacterium]|nr:fibronectin type III domain-containing protein [Gemmatimonadota bacterium]